LGLDQLAHGFVAEVDRFDHVLFGQLVGAPSTITTRNGVPATTRISLTALDLAVGWVSTKSSAKQATRTAPSAVEGDFGQHGWRSRRRSRRAHSRDPFHPATGMWRPPGGRPVAQEGTAAHRAGRSGAWWRMARSGGGFAAEEAAGVCVAAA